VIRAIYFGSKGIVSKYYSFELPDGIWSVRAFEPVDEESSGILAGF
jgi:hypothetical protein